MSEIMGERSTHTSQHFLEFAFDLLDYAFPKYNCKWTRPGQDERSYKKIFKESFGDAVILYRNRHEKEFQERIDKYSLTVSDIDADKYFDYFSETTFKGQIPLMEVIDYFAFVLNTSLYFSSWGATAGIFAVLDHVFVVFHKYVEPYFTIVGGWHALFRVAEQYVDYVNLIPASIVSESSSGVDPVAKL